MSVCNGEIAYLTDDIFKYPTEREKFFSIAKEWSMAAMNYVYGRPDGTYLDEDDYSPMSPFSCETVTGVGNMKVVQGNLEFYNAPLTYNCPLPLSLIRYLYYHADGFTQEQQGRAYDVLAGAVACMAKDEYFVGEEGLLVPELPSALVLSLSRIVNLPALLQECEKGHYGFRVMRGEEYVKPPTPFLLSAATQQRLESGPSIHRTAVRGSISTRKTSEISLVRDATCMWCHQFGLGLIRHMEREAYRKGAKKTIGLGGWIEEIPDNSVERTFELNERLTEAFDLCSEEERFAFEYLAQKRSSGEEPSIPQIARLLGKSVGTTNQMLFRARKKIRSRCLP